METGTSIDGAEDFVDPTAERILVLTGRVSNGRARFWTS